MSTSNSKSMFQTFESGGLHLENRVVMAPMTRMMCEKNIPGDENAAYYRRRVEAGVGLIITEGTAIDHPGAHAYPNVPSFYGEKALAGWKKVLDAVHEAGGKIMPQLWHGGPYRQKETLPDLTTPAYGPIEMRDGDELTCIAMSQQDIDDVVQAFAKAALQAKQLGFDGVELHGAHSYLLDAFLWKGSNQREDQYGGSMENRLRFAVEVVKAVREKVGADFPIVFRYSQWKQQDYDARIADTPEELAAILMPLVDAGVNIFHVSTRRFWEAAFNDSDLSLAAWTKKITGKPVIAVGSIGIDAPLDLELFVGKAISNKPVSVVDAESAIERGEFDLMAVGRALLADAEWVKKIRDGGVEEITAFNSDALAELL